MQKVYDKNTPTSIQSLFNSIAPSYDLTNTLLSFGFHKWWNLALVKELGKPKTLLDLCAGTGEISFLMIKKNEFLKEALMLDFSKEMLAEAKHKSLKIVNKKVALSFIQSDATSIPLENQSVDAISIAYGIRNIKEPNKCIQEAFRVLKPKAKFAILELTRPKFKMILNFHNLYLKIFLPLIGKIMAKNKEAYMYLSQSIPQFIAPQKLKEMMIESGFEKVKVKSKLFGIATIICGIKP
jgi:demethylmenaquinone methyltransferase/2-methoxy-6-polyprenyl-1,4-benzoquinol methylase